MVCGTVMEACGGGYRKRQGLRGMCRGVCRTVLEACRLVLWGVTGCRRHVELYLDVYEMSQGDQKKRGGTSPHMGAGTSPWKDYVMKNLPVCWVGWVSLCLVDK